MTLWTVCRRTGAPARPLRPSSCIAGTHALARRGPAGQRGGGGHPGLLPWQQRCIPSLPPDVLQGVPALSHGLPQSRHQLDRLPPALPRQRRLLFILSRCSRLLWTDQLASAAANAMPQGKPPSARVRRRSALGYREWPQGGRRSRGVGGTCPNPPPHQQGRHSPTHASPAPLIFAVAAQKETDATAAAARLMQAAGSAGGSVDDSVLPLARSM
jgi:hypothetical protein